MKNFLKKISSGHAGPTVGAKVMSVQHIIDIFLLLFGLFPQVSLAIRCFQVVTKYILAISHHMLNIYLFSYFLSPFDMFLCSSALSFQWRRTLKTSRLIINHLLLLQPPPVFLNTGWFQIGPCPGWLRPPLVFPDVSPYDGCMTVLLQVIMDDDGKTNWLINSYFQNGTIVSQSGIVHSTCVSYQPKASDYIKVLHLYHNHIMHYIST